MPSAIGATDPILPLLHPDFLKKPQLVVFKDMSNESPITFANIRRGNVVVIDFLEHKPKLDLTNLLRTG